MYLGVIATVAVTPTALVEGLTLITVNGEDFRDVPGLELVVWEAGGAG